MKISQPIFGILVVLTKNELTKIYNIMYLIFNPKKYFELNFDLDFYCFQLTGKLQLLWKVFLMRREVPGVPNGILSCPVLPMPLALVTFGGSPISASRTVVVSGFFCDFLQFLLFMKKQARKGFRPQSAIFVIQNQFEVSYFRFLLRTSQFPKL